MTHKEVDGLQAWDGEARRLQHETGRPVTDCRDDIIALYLMQGDPRPFVDWTFRGHTTKPKIMLLLAQMLHPSPRKSLYGENLKFGFVRYDLDGKKGRWTDPTLVERNRVVGEHVAALIERDGPGSYDASISDTAGRIQLSKRTVKAAHDEHSRRARKPRTVK